MMKRSRRWYQLSPRAYWAAIIVVAWVCQFTCRGLGLVDTGWARAISLLACLLSIAVDHFTSVRMLRVIERAKSMRVDHGFYEANLLIGNVQTVEAFVRNRSVWAINLCAIIASILRPWFGVTILIVKVYAALNNTIMRRDLLALLTESSRSRF